MSDENIVDDDKLNTDQAQSSPRANDTSPGSAIVPISVYAEDSTDDCPEPDGSWPEFENTHSGLFWFREDSKGNVDSIRLGPRLNVLVRAQNSNGNRSCRVLGFQDFTGVEKTVTIFDDDLLTSFLTVVGTLADEGYDVEVPQAQYKAIQAYIISCKPARTGILAEQNGWGEGATGPYYVNGGEVISLLNNIVVVDPAIQDTGFFSKAGSLNGWNAEVADRCNGNETLMLMTTLALAAPLFRPCRKEALGVNLIGTSGHGKTTSQMVGASVFGKPAKDGLVRTCRTTISAFEQSQKALNDSIQFLDELGEVEPRVLDAILYMSTDGTEKGRMKVSGGLRPVKSSSVVTAMTGELSTVAVLTEGNIKARTGQVVRIGNIDIGDLCPNGTFPDCHGIDDVAEFLDDLADARSEHYGWAGPEFIKYLMGDLPDFVKQTKVIVKEFTKAVCQPDGPSGHRRFAQFLGIVCAAGHFAYDAEIVPWNHAATNRMTRNVFDAWVKGVERSELDPDLEIFQRVRGLIQQHGKSKFASWKDANGKFEKSDIWGYRRDNNDTVEYYVFPSIFKSRLFQEGCAHKRFVEILKARHCLKTEGHANSIRSKPPAAGRKQSRYYCITDRIFDDVPEEMDFEVEPEKWPTKPVHAGSNEVFDDVENDKHVVPDRLKARYEVLEKTRKKARHFQTVTRQNAEQLDD